MTKSIFIGKKFLQKVEGVLITQHKWGYAWRAKGHSFIPCGLPLEVGKAVG